jgi:ribosomal protein L7Ae-like RNA K-turn-binding protein
METRTGSGEVLRLLGIARRAGGVAPGTQGARRALSSGTAKLVVIADDASPVQLKKIESIIRKKAVPRVVLGDRVLLGAAVGEPGLSALAVTDAGLAEQILRRLGAGTPTESQFK